MSSSKIYIPNLVGLQVLALETIFEEDESSMAGTPGSSAMLVNHQQPDIPSGPWTHKPFDYIPEDAF